MAVSHRFSSLKTDSPDPTIIQPSHWNNTHYMDNGCLLMTQNASNTWVITKPDGSVLATPGTTTMGFQEAINYATANNLHLRVIGATAIPGAQGVINCTTPIIVPPLENCAWEILSVTINFPSSIGSNDCIVFDSIMASYINMGGTQIVNAGSGRTIVFHPRNRLPADPNTVITSSTFLGGLPVNIHTPTSDCDNVPLVDFDLSAGGCNDASFSWEEMNASGCALRVQTPGGGFSLRGCKFTCQNVHSQTGTALPVVLIGTSTTSAINLNVFKMSCQLNVEHKVGFDTWGIKDVIDSNVFIGGNLLTPGLALFFESTADNNLAIGQYQGATAASGSIVSVGGTQNNNRVISQHPKINVSVLVGASPNVYQNLDFMDEFITLNNAGSTVTDIQFSADGVTYGGTSLAVWAGVLPVGSYMKIIYSGSAPTMRKIL